MGSWHEENLTRVKTRLQQELVKKEEALTKLQETIQEHHEAMPLSIATAKVNTMTETTMVRSPSIEKPSKSTMKKGHFPFPLSKSTS
jgi:hypothetical protein